MDFNEYQDAAARTWGDQIPHRLIAELNEDEVRDELIQQVEELGQRMTLGVLGLGISGEAGEVADEIKKYVGHGHWKDGFDMPKELGDVLWYVATICQALDLDMGEVAEKNIAKLRARYPQGFSTEASKTRADTKDPEQVERPPPIGEQVLDLIKANWPQQDDNATHKTATNFLLRAMPSSTVRFGSSSDVYTFLRHMKDGGAHIMAADDPSVPCKGWVVRWPPDTDRTHLHVTITVSDMRNSTDPRHSYPQDRWDGLLTPPDMG
jgi:NTP pyrophosphatase (non-canonical NTP hydrolase)